MKKKILTLTSLMLLGDVSIANANTGFYVGAEGGINFLRLRPKESDKTLKSRAGDFGIFAGYGRQYPSAFYLGFQVDGGMNFAKKAPESISAPTSNEKDNTPLLVTADISLTVDPNPKYYYGAEIHIGYSVSPKVLIYGILGIEGKVCEIGTRNIVNEKITIKDSFEQSLRVALQTAGLNLDANKVLNFSSDMTMVANASGKDETIEGFTFPKTDMKKTNIFMGVLGLGTQYSITPNIDVGFAVKAKLGFKNKLNISDATIQNSHFSVPDEFDQAASALASNVQYKDSFMGLTTGKAVLAYMEKHLKEKIDEELNELKNTKIRVVDYSVALSLRYRF